jgi:hypothetical protein
MPKPRASFLCAISVTSLRIGHDAFFLIAVNVVNA